MLFTKADCQKIIKSKIEASPVKSGHYMAFKHYSSTSHLQQIWLQTLVAIDSESHLTLFPSFWAQPSEVAALFYLNLGRRSFLGQFESEQTPLPRTGRRFRPAALHRIQFGTWGFVPMSIFLLGDWWLIKRLRDWCCFGWEIGAALVDCFGQKTKAAPEEIVLLWLTTFLPIPLKISFHKKIAS